MRRRRGPADATLARRQRVIDIFNSGASLCGREMAALLGSTESTVREDIKQLRRIGYDIIASPGAGGGYRLRRKSALWPAGRNTEGD